MSPEPVKILAVDDIEENLTALEALLKRDDVEIVKARSGMQALELLLVEDVALALLDVQMPGMDGFELAELMRGTERTRRVPIVFLTAVGTDERRRFRGYESGAVDYLFKPVDPDILRHKVAIFVELFQQRQELARERDQHASALARLQAHGDNSPLAIVEFDAGQQIVAWSAGAERMFGWRAAQVTGIRALEMDWLDPEDAGAFGALVGEMIAGRRLRAMQPLRMRTAEGVTLHCECYISALLDGRGRLLSVNAQILDVTERKRAEETQRLLIGELNHRVKNTLASVQAIAAQTLRHSSGPSDFAPTFIGRIHALASAHSLLSSSTWQGANLRALIDGQIDIGTIDASQLELDGPELELAPELALHLALILHELVTNAHKYGALSVPEGRVSLRWTIEDERLVMNWVESGGPRTAVPTRKGFGSALIERSLRAEGGTAVPDYAEGGVRWVLTLPAGPRLTLSAARENKGGAPEANVDTDGATIAGCRFILIEDEPLVAMEIADALEDQGATIHGVAASAQEALDLVAAGGFDAALLDGNLQGQAVDAVAAALAHGKTPFAFVTGYDQHHLPKGFESRPLIVKPFDRGTLVSRAAELVARPGAPAADCTTVQAHVIP